MTNDAASVLSRMKLDGRVAVVTGAARGMGRVIAQQLIALGAIVVLADRSSAVEATAKELERPAGRADWMVLDVTHSASVEAGMSTVVERHGRIDILVANAGISYEEQTATHSDESWRRVLAVNLDGYSAA
jgi:NAD(P)-dependent dehydrogenase (short-subunit alcohol dehydrogenase family)